MTLLHSFITWKHNEPVEVQHIKRRFKMLQLYIFFSNIPILIEIISDLFFEQYQFAVIYTITLLLLNSILWIKKDTLAFAKIKVYITVTMLFGLFILLSIISDPQGTGLTPFTLLPFIFITLMGVKRGVITISLFMVILTTLYLFAPFPTAIFNFQTYITLFITILLSSIIASLLDLMLNYEIKAVFESTTNLITHQKELENLVDERTMEAVNTQSQLRLQHISNHLTKLPNNVRLNELYNPKENHFGIRISINNPEVLLTFYGPEFVNKMIISFSNNLKTIAYAKQMTVFHIHSYEFFLLGFDAAQQEPLTQQEIEAIHLELSSAPVVVDGENYFFTLTMGVAKNSDALLIHSNIALTRAFEEEKNCMIYESSWDYEHQIKHNLQVIQELRTAMETDNICAFFQPIVDAKTEKIIKYESLVRMRMPNGTIRLPHYFLDIAKTARLSEQITQIMLKKVIEMATIHPFDFSLNLTASDIQNPLLREEILHVISSSGVGHKLIIEVIESEQIQNYSLICSFLQKLKMLNVRIAIDDFGSGYSNFNQLKELGADILKIDGSLIRDITTNKEHFHIVQTIITMVKHLHLKSVVEYVENREIKELLCTMDVDFLQGFYYSKATETID